LRTPQIQRPVGAVWVDALRRRQFRAVERANGDCRAPDRRGRGDSGQPAHLVGDTGRHPGGGDERAFGADAVAALRDRLPLEVVLQEPHRAAEPTASTSEVSTVTMPRALARRFAAAR
jgi:hypothetical protein